MDSKRKDARWARALTYIEDLGLEFEDLSFQGFQKFLDSAEEAFVDCPDQIDFWYNSWQIRQGEKRDL